MYLAALAASNQQRAHLPPEPLEPGKRAVVLAGSQRIAIAYRDVAGPGEVPVILIHGSPGDSDVFNRLSQELEGPRRLIIPDLPGFGQSTHDLPDYSFHAHAWYVWRMLDALGVRRVHLVGFSMGGGVALNMAQRAPDRVASITMLSAIGVQEMEMLGDYGVNHALHGAQLAGLWLLNAALPRFGSWNRVDMGVAYARNFYDSDQRPLRAILKSYSAPMLILHGEHDPLVPVEAAHEHERLVPQSELHVLGGDHFMTFQHPRLLVIPMLDFWGRVESGKALTRAKALPDRIARAALPRDMLHHPPAGFVTAAVIFLALGCGTFVSEDVACISAGVMVAEGRIGFLFACGACLAGIVAGDVLLFLAGRWIGPLRWITKSGSLEHASQWLQRNGAGVIFLSRFTPGTRLPTYVAAGMLRTSLRKFLGYFLLAAMAWTPLIVGLSAGVGLPFANNRAFASLSLTARLFIGGAVILAVTRLLIACASYRGRRRLVGRLKRLRRWEFWPPFVFYPPVIAYILYLGLRFRSFTLFTSVNPSMPASGFIGESKHQILGLFQSPNGWLPQHTLIHHRDPERRIDEARIFMEQQALVFPVVLKPDAGQRGSGVAVIRSQDELAEYLSNSTLPVILQEYVPGREFGVFYYRYPGDAAGRIFSITEKVMPVLNGDGRRTLEQLVLSDSRAVCMSGFYLQKHAGAAQQVPGNGEAIQLVEIGTHCRGAIFLDGGHAITPQLEGAIDRIAQTVRGFYFGRFDIRVPEASDLPLGERLKVLELNGVTSEATHIYDPKLSVFDAYGVLFASGELHSKSAIETVLPACVRHRLSNCCGCCSITGVNRRSIGRETGARGGAARPPSRWRHVLRSRDGHVRHARSGRSHSDRIVSRTLGNGHRCPAFSLRF